MIESMTDIPTADGKMDSFIVHPEEGGPFPCVFVLMDIWGLREELFDVARRIATSGYYCVLPNFWYRRGKVRFEYRDDKGKMLSMKDLPADKQAELKANMSLVTDTMAVADIKSAMAFAGKGPVKAGPMGSIGYCRQHLAGHFPRDGEPARHASRQRASGLAASLHRQVPWRNLLRLCRTRSARAAVDHRDAGKADGRQDERQIQRAGSRRCASRLFAAGPQHLRQGGGKPRLGADHADVQKAVGLTLTPSEQAERPACG